jgi:hypothetical protein
MFEVSTTIRYYCSMEIHLILTMLNSNTCSCVNKNICHCSARKLLSSWTRSSVFRSNKTNYVLIEQDTTRFIWTKTIFVLSTTACVPFETEDTSSRWTRTHVVLLINRQCLLLNEITFLLVLRLRRGWIYGRCPRRLLGYNFPVSSRLDSWAGYHDLGSPYGEFFLAPSKIDFIDFRQTEAN